MLGQCLPLLQENQTNQTLTRQPPGRLLAVTFYIHIKMDFRYIGQKLEITKAKFHFATYLTVASCSPTRDLSPLLRETIQTAPYPTSQTDRQQVVRETDTER